MPPEDGEAVIRISVKDLVTELKTDFREQLSGVTSAMANGFGRVEKGLEAKADKADIKRIEETLREHQNELDAHRAQLSRLETQQKADETASETTEKITKARHDRLSRIYAAAGVMAGALTGWFTYLLAHHQ